MAKAKMNVLCMGSPSMHGMFVVIEIDHFNTFILN